MTPNPRQRLEEWQLQQTEAQINATLAYDAAFRLSMEAITQAEEFDLNPFEAFLVGVVAREAVEGLSEAEWLLDPDSKLDYVLNLEKISPTHKAKRLAEAIANLKFVGLWPW